MSFIIGADIVPTQSNIQSFISGDVEKLIGFEMLDLLTKQDFRIFNLEAPLCDKDTPIPKFGSNLRMPTLVVDTFAKLGINAFTLANNHILDQGEKGISSTIQVLSKYSIDYLGAGKSKEEAARPLYFSNAQKKIGFYACCDNELYIQNETLFAINTFSSIKSINQIRSIKEKCDYLVVLYHGGKEMYRYPSPLLQDMCHEIINAGADLVICQHSHCIGCYEQYNNSYIIYGQGNFLFDAESNEYWNSGLLVKVNDAYELEFLPYIKSKGCIRLANDSEKKDILDGFELRSKEIKNPDFIKHTFNEYCNTVRRSYLSMLMGKRKQPLFRIMNKLTNYNWADYYIKRHYNRTSTLMIMNLLKCYAHREILLELLAEEEKRFLQK